MGIRKAKVSDISFLEKIGKEVREFKVSKESKGFWNKEQLKNWILSKNDIILIAEDKEEIIGFVMFAHHVPTGKVTFENGWVRSDYRGKDIISKLTKEGLKQLKLKGARYVCGLVKKDNSSSIKFLRKNQFRKGSDFSWLHRKL